MTKLILFLLCSFHLTAFAHPIDLGFLNISQKEKTIAFDLDISPAIAAELLEISEDQLSKLDLSTSDVFFTSVFSQSKVMTPDQKECLLKSEKAKIKYERFMFSGSADCLSDASTAQLSFSFLKKARTSFQLVVKVADSSGNIRDFNLSPEKNEIDLKNQTSHSWSDFLGLGISHIGATKDEWYDSEKGLHFPEGLDHILFVIALVLGSAQLLNIIKTVSGFTLGHSITLALATLQLIHVPSRIVESCIALSIAFVAGEALWFKNSRSQWRIALIFGLIHGLGFATALTELNLNRSDLVRGLIGFNVGVELGQLVIVLVTLPIILWINKKSFGKKWVTPGFAVVILLLGSFWFIQRAFGLG